MPDSFPAALRARALVLVMMALLATPVRGAGLLEDPAALSLRLPHPPAEINGLAWFNEDAPVLRRLPARLKDSFRAPVWELAQSPSGGRIRLRTDSTHLGLIARNPDASMMHHMTSVGQNGMDLYVDGTYRASAWPDGDGRMQREWLLGETRAMREVVLYLPLYKPVTVERLVLDPGARLEAPRPFAQEHPIVFYGSSITQGGCAENTGLSYAAILGRSLNMDFVNLGFSGNGMGEPALATAMAEIDAAAYVLDYWANPSSKVYAETLPGFVEILRASHPQTPILVVSPFWFSGEATSASLREEQEAKRRFARTWVTERRRAGDRKLDFVEGRTLLSPEQGFGLVDGVHPNSLGFQFCADGLEPHLRRVLHLPRRAR